MTSDRESRLSYARHWAGNSPYYRHMGFAVDSLDEGRARLKLFAGMDLLNADGILHGGVLPSLADAAMGSALRTLVGDAAQLLTVESNLRYLRPVAGEGGSATVVADGRVVRAGGHVAVVEVDLTDGEGQLVARGGGTFMLRAEDRS
jgi:uncharacterized protein (TIGR00369 family)